VPASQSTVRPRLRAMSSDADSDVQFYSAETLANMSA
jgi:hypothetical protein